MEINFENATEFARKHWNWLVIIGLFFLIWVKLGRIEEVDRKVRNIEAGMMEVTSGVEQLQSSMEEFYVNTP